MVEESQRVEVSLSYGVLVGVSQRDVVSFRGVPYAKAARFCAPEPIQELPCRKLNCFKSGPACPQPPLLIDPSKYLSVSGACSLVKSVWRLDIPVPSLDHKTFNEDCHNLQIYTPMRGGGGPFPVLVFIHGGGFCFGSNKDVQYQHAWGCKLALMQNIVVVLVNYRLGCLGFCTVPGGVTNLGVLDVISALEFVRREIEAFGGDPLNITVAGESAGAMMIGAMLHCRLTVGLFSRCIMMSGGLQHIMSHEDHKKVSDAFLARVVDPQNAPVEVLLKAQCSLIGVWQGRYGSLPFLPVYGELIGTNICHTDIDILIGVCDQEGSLFIPQTQLYPDLSKIMLIRELQHMNVHANVVDVEKVLSLIPREYPGYAKVTSVFSALFQESPLVLSCEKMIAAGNHVIAYRNFLSKAHVGELPYIFGTWDRGLYTRLLAGLPWRPSQADIKRATMQETIWMNVVGGFSRSGHDALPLQASIPEALYICPEGVHKGPIVGAFAAAVAEATRLAVRPFGVQIPESRL